MEQATTFTTDGTSENDGGLLVPTASGEMKVCVQGREVENNNDGLMDPIVQELPREDEAMLGNVAMTHTGGGDKCILDEDGDPIELSASLTTNSYSIIFVSNPTSWVFFFGIAIFFFQVGLASLTLVDLVDSNFKADNPLRVPANVQGYVRIAGYMSLILAVANFGDLLDAIETFSDGYHCILREQAPHATRWYG